MVRSQKTNELGQLKWVALFFLNVRNCMGCYDVSTLGLTIIINVLLFMSIDYNRVKPFFLIILAFIPLMIYNPLLLTIIDIFLFVLLFSGDSIKSIVKVNTITLFCAAIIILGFVKMGIIDSQVINVTKTSMDDVKIAHEATSLGMKNTNTAGMLFFILISQAYLYLISNKRSSIYCFLLLALSYIAYKSFHARTAFLSFVILIIMHFIMPLFKNKLKVRYIIASLPCLLYVVFFYIMINIDQYMIIDRLITNRFSIPLEIIQRMSFYNWIIGINAELDSSFIMMILLGGVPLFVFWVISFYKSISRYFYLLFDYIPYILSILIFGLFENVFSSCNAASIIFWILILKPIIVDPSKLNY